MPNPFDIAEQELVSTATKENPFDLAERQAANPFDIAVKEPQNPFFRGGSLTGVPAQEPEFPVPLSRPEPAPLTKAATQTIQAKAKPTEPVPPRP